MRRDRPAHRRGRRDRRVLRHDRRGRGDGAWAALRGILVTAPLPRADALDTPAPASLRGADIRVVADHPRLVARLAAAGAGGRDGPCRSSSTLDVGDGPHRLPRDRRCRRPGRASRRRAWSLRLRRHPGLLGQSAAGHAVCANASRRIARSGWSGSARRSRRWQRPACRPRSSPAAAPAAIASTPRPACSPRSSRARTCSSIPATARSASRENDNPVRTLAVRRGERRLGDHAGQRRRQCRLEGLRRR